MLSDVAPKATDERSSPASRGTSSSSRNTGNVRRAAEVETIERLGLLVVRLVGDVRPILENSTACTIVNAN
jgi:hypothetical protein